MLLPVIGEVSERDRADQRFGFTCSGSCDYLAGRAVLVRHRRSTRVGAWPPISE